MKICKLKPEYNKCCDCLDNQIKNSIVLSCQECLLKDNRSYEIVKEGWNLFFGKYVVILKDDEYIKIKKNRVYDIKEI